MAGVTANEVDVLRATILFTTGCDELFFLFEEVGSADSNAACVRCEGTASAPGVLRRGRPIGPFRGGGAMVEGGVASVCAAGDAEADACVASDGEAASDLSSLVSLARCDAGI